MATYSSVQSGVDIGDVRAAGDLIERYTSRSPITIHQATKDIQVGEVSYRRDGPVEWIDAAVYDLGGWLMLVDERIIALTSAKLLGADGSEGADVTLETVGASESELDRDLYRRANLLPEPGGGVRLSGTFGWGTLEPTGDWQISTAGAVTGTGVALAAGEVLWADGARYEATGAAQVVPSPDAAVTSGVSRLIPPDDLRLASEAIAKRWATISVAASFGPGVPPNIENQPSLPSLTAGLEPTLNRYRRRRLMLL